MLDNLPSEISDNILHRLPVKSLIKCSSLSKSYFHLITCPAFIKSHLALSTTSHLLLHYYALRDKKEFYHLEPDTDPFSGFQTRGLSVPFHNVCGDRFTVAGCVNGIICLVNHSRSGDTSVILWNPSIRKCVHVPKPHYIYETYGNHESACGFGYDSISDDYKVVRYVYLGGNCEDTVFEVYSLKSGCWRLGGAGPSYTIKLHSTSCFLHGSVHWYACKWGHYVIENFILKFDVSLETFEVIEMPRMLIRSDRKSPPWFYVQECWGMLGIIWQNYNEYPQNCSIWVMKEYGVVNSWSKIFDFSSANLRKGEGMPKALGFRKNGQVIMVKHNYRDVRHVPWDGEGEGEGEGEGGGEGKGKGIGKGHVVRKHYDVIVSFDPLTHGATVLREIYGRSHPIYMATYVESMELFQQGKRIEDLTDGLQLIPSNREHE